jgi:hypothetical protein
VAVRALRTAVRGRGAGSGVVSRGWCRDSNRVSVVSWGPVVKDQGDRLLTAIGGDGGAEDRMVLCTLRHHIIGVRNLWLGWRVNRRLHGLHGWCGRLLLALGLPLPL